MFIIGCDFHTRYQQIAVLLKLRILVLRIRPAHFRDACGTLSRFSDPPSSLLHPRLPHPLTP